MTLLDHTAAQMVDATVVDDLSHEIDLNSDVLFSWDYRRSRPALSKLYEKAKRSQWNASTDLDWSIEVDWEKLAADQEVANERFKVLRSDDSPLSSWGEKEWKQFRREMQISALSQFLHGEQGALICTGLITATTPWVDAKYYAATQVMDEARHVEVFARYLDEKAGDAYPINPQLGELLDLIIADGRWDITYLGMQVMVEGLALAAFGFLHALTTEPLLKKLLRYVMSDEARHVAFGVISLKELYDGLSASEIRERQEFAYEAAVRLQQRFLGREVMQKLGADPDVVYGWIEEKGDPGQHMFQKLLFSKIVPNCKKLGLLDAGDGWLRDRFAELQIIEFEDWTDTSDEYETFDAIADKIGMAEKG
jgi:hypothetical protein